MTDQQRWDALGCYAMIAQVNEWVGKLLATLDRKGLRENTLVVFTSDHGEMLGDHGLESKMIMFGGSDHIPLILRLPGVIPAGTRVARPVSYVDYFATILDYAGPPIPPNEGRSLRALIDGKADALDFAVSAWGAVESGGPFPVRKGDWKLIVYATGAQRLPRIPVSALYNLQEDPLELNNLIGGKPPNARRSPRLSFATPAACFSICPAAASATSVRPGAIGTRNRALSAGIPPFSPHNNSCGRSPDIRVRRW